MEEIHAIFPEDDFAERMLPLPPMYATRAMKAAYSKRATKRGKQRSDMATMVNDTDFEM